MSALPIDRANPQPTVNKALISGRIDYCRRYETNQGESRYEQRVILPAPDNFSTPQVVLVESRAKLGNSGEEIKVVVSIGGYRDQYKDKAGEQILTARVKLVAVE
jgi:hypothetical protein